VEYPFNLDVACLSEREITVTKGTSKGQMSGATCLGIRISEEHAVIVKHMVLG